ncbi:hypothetical protein D039_1269A, partial [Vibrio parahaemolyticus EKP-028]
MVQPEL